MSGRRQCGNSEDSQTAAKKTKRTVSLPTFRKWQRELNKVYNSVVWLKCEQNGATGTVVAMWAIVKFVVITRTRYSLYGTSRLFGSQGSF